MEERENEKNLDAWVEEISDDLDDLRTALINALLDYEKRLDNAIGEIPVWTEITIDDIRRLYEIPKIKDGLLGPRSLAIIAQTLDEHVDKWLLSNPALSEKKMDPSEINSYRKSCADVENEFIKLGDAARKISKDAIDTLGADLDRVMTRLESERERDEDALKELVVDGSVERGMSAREEIADLWERYRSHAENLNNAWDTLEALVFEGMDMTAAGIEDMRWILRQSEDAITVFNPLLSPEYTPLKIPEREGPRTTFELERDAEDEEIEKDSDRETIEITRHTEIESKPNSEKTEKFDKLPKTFSYTAFREIQILKPISWIEFFLAWVLPIASIVLYFTLPSSLPIWSLSIPISWFLLFPILRKWKFQPFPKRSSTEDDDISIIVTLSTIDEKEITIDGKEVLFNDTKILRWEDSDAMGFGWIVITPSALLSSLETNITRWESATSKIVTKDTEAYALETNAFYHVCESLNINF